jgi:hypothetical protein
MPSLQFNVDHLYPCAPTGITFQVYPSSIKNKSESRCRVHTLPSMLWRGQISPRWTFFATGEVETLLYSYTRTLDWHESSPVCFEIYCTHLIQWIWLYEPSLFDSRVRAFNLQSESIQCATIEGKYSRQDMSQRRRGCGSWVWFFGTEWICWLRKNTFLSVD